MAIKAVRGAKQKGAVKVPFDQLITERKIGKVEAAMLRKAMPIDEHGMINAVVFDIKREEIRNAKAGR